MRSLILKLSDIAFLFVSITGCISQVQDGDSTGSPNFSDAIQKAKPAVVLVKAIHEHEFRNPSTKNGSGVIISEDGYIVTNNHVINKANGIEITLGGNRRYPAKVIGTDPETDLALLKIEIGADKLTYLKFGDSSILKEGDWVLTIGHPLDLPFTITKGIVSAKNRGFEFSFNGKNIEDFIQTDAATNPGSNGSALINLKGELVGINSGFFSNTTNFIGYSLAIPSSIVQNIISQLKQVGSAHHAVLGIVPYTVNADLIAREKLTRNYGVYVEAFYKSSPAHKAGIKEGDVIIAIDNVKIENLPQLTEKLIELHSGDNVKVKVYRKDKELDIDVLLKDDKELKINRSRRGLA